MKKIFILPILIAPIVAHATNPVGPSAVGQGETPVVATANAPYATAGAETGDTTNVVSASYVKGAYNDAIAAVNKVNADKQAKLLNGSNNHNIESKVVAGSGVHSYVAQALPYGYNDNSHNGVKSEIASDMGVQNLDDALISANIVLDGFQAISNIKQNQFTDFNTGEPVNSEVISADFIDDMNHSIFDDNGLTNVRSDLSADFTSADQVLVSAGGVLYLVNGAKEYTDGKRVSAVTTWGNDTATKLPLTNN